MVVGWATGHPLRLNLDPFMAVVLALSVMHGAIITSDAQSHWLLGVQLVSVYVIIATAYFVSVTTAMHSRVGHWPRARVS